MIKLNLGCGRKILNGWINIDKIPQHPEVVEDDVSILENIQDETVDIIYACHVLEHFGRHEIENVAKCWSRKLKSGGKIRIAVPDFEAVCKRYIEKKDIKEMIGFTSGGQKNEYDYHKIVFDFHSLKNLLEKAGFEDIKRYDWKATDHSHVDDYSQSYLPHMDKENGTLMSLNVEATKI